MTHTSKLAAKVAGRNRANQTTMSMKPSRENIFRVACEFRAAPRSSAHRHVDTYNLIASVGGPAAIAYGIWMATPDRNRWQKLDRGHDVAGELEKASRLSI